MGGKAGDRIGHRDRVRLGLFADAWVFQGTVRGGQGWQLFPGVRQDTSGVSISACVAACAGGGGSSFLFLEAEGCDCGIGRDPPDPSVFGAGGWVDCAENPSAGYATAVPDVVIPVTGVTGVCGVSLHIVQSRKLAEGDAVCSGHPAYWSDHLSGTGVEGI